MASIKNMLEFGKTFEGAEQIALERIRSGDSNIILDLQLLYAAQGKNDLVEQWDAIADQCLPFSPRRAFNKAYHFMRNGNLSSAMECLYISRQERLFGSPAPKILSNLWNGEISLKDKRVILFCEGGLGDEIINVRFAKNLKELGAKTIIVCNQSLVNLFSTLENANCVISNTAINSVYADYWIPAMSAPKFLNISYGKLDNTPYIKPIINKAWDFIVPKTEFNVGIRWAGNPKFEHEQFRKFPVELILNLSNIPGVKLYSLQKDADMVSLPVEITDLAPLLYTWEDTANAIFKMDLIITSCTSVAHLSASMGQKTWIIVPIMPYYLWARNETDWYNSVKLYRQTKFGEWNDVFEKVKNDLEKENQYLKTRKEK